MQTDYKLAYKIASEKKGKSEKLYKDLGNYVFAELGRNLRRPKSLIIKLKGVGYWFLRWSRMDGILRLYPFDYDRTKEDFASELTFLKYENKREIYELFKERLKDYERWYEKKRKIRAIRNETQVLLEPDKGEDGS